MKELFLVTTALEDTWPGENESILFLGEWCRLYSRKAHWVKLDSEIAPYPWNDREKLYNDYKYLKELFEELLLVLANELNNMHGVSHSVRYWRILIGPWLIVFLPTVYDRWTCLTEAIEAYPITKTKVHNVLDFGYIPQSMEHFSALVKNDLWNHALYAFILKFTNFPKVSKIKDVNASVISEKNLLGVNQNKRSRFVSVLTYFRTLFSYDSCYFFIKSYLSKVDSIKLQFKLKQIPVFFESLKVTESQPRITFRSFDLLAFESKNDFELLVKKLIPLQLPITYLEGYRKSIDQVSSSNWPKKPKLIWTSNSYHMDDMFKLWAAERVNEGVPLTIGQHGGHYGQGLFNFTEYHEIKISDYYFSWGWGRNLSKVIPVGYIKKAIVRKNNKVARDPILFLLSGTSRYSSGIQSLPVSVQWLEYFNDQVEFYKNIPENLFGDIIVRVDPFDGGWSQYERWNDIFPNSIIDDGKQDFNKVLSGTKLLVSGWNTTTYLESMHSNIPTVVFWRPKYFELRDDAKLLFANLKKVGILHDDPISAAEHVNNIYNDIDAWWNRADVISARNDFTNEYAYSNNLLEKLSGVLKDISDKQCLK